MVRHLTAKVRQLQRLVPSTRATWWWTSGATTRRSSRPTLARACGASGIDPTGVKFKSYYGDGIDLIPDFFSAEAFRARYGDARARIVTSIAMFYDLEAPLDFVREVAAILADDGIWHFEQSYMPSMLRMNSYDTICHEHLEYYSLPP